MKLELNNPEKFIRTNTKIHEAPLVPELKLHLADEAIALWQLTEKELEDTPLPPPFWAFAWAGGQALARYILDNPELVTGKAVLDFAAGCGIAGIAAKRAGAARVLAADIDPLAAAACTLNGQLNKAPIETTYEDLLNAAPEAWDIIVTGDICYEQPLAGRVIDWLHGHAQNGTSVLIGDPGRTYLPKDKLETLTTYAVKTIRDLEDTDVRNTTVWRLLT